MGGRLEGKVAVVTGAGSGIGAAIAERFVGEGAGVVAVDISGRQKAVADRLGRQCHPVQADVSLSPEVQAMLQAAVDTFGRVDVLVNNAGIEGAGGAAVRLPRGRLRAGHGGQLSRRLSRHALWDSGVAG
ncbi:SDR family NAD(P)-dependent oxidoreductase [Sporichthya sp.]|uniref:SDR family NAD(P)-dependent oxidoreductase n=1 Tax=Sporichthya sp. TaxID=65475 RepID=UPI0025EFC2AB|nr:SDR family NAD(P)-dependent oxidoreductase [Sporichthya sp.]